MVTAINNYDLVQSALHGALAQHTLFDMDGVLTPEVWYNEPDVASYQELCEQHHEGAFWHHLHSSPPYLLPSAPILAVVTGRLSFYEAQTAAWLAMYDVELIMGLCMAQCARPSERPARDKCGNTACLKASALEHPLAELFIESKQWQAEEIYRLTLKPVFCMQNMKLYGEIHL